MQTYSQVSVAFLADVTGKAKALAATIDVPFAQAFRLVDAGETARLHDEAALVHRKAADEARHGAVEDVRALIAKVRVTDLRLGAAVRAERYAVGAHGWAEARTALRDANQAHDAACEALDPFMRGHADIAALEASLGLPADLCIED